jgi:hypothetical protein
MNTIPASQPSVLPAGLLLAAIPLLHEYKLPAPSAAEVLQATGATKTTAYKVKAALEAVLPNLLRPAGRPPGEPDMPVPDSLRVKLQAATLGFVYDHPGCVSGTGARRRYGDAFRRFVLDLGDAHGDLEVDEIAQALALPLGTLKDWLRVPPPQEDVESRARSDEAVIPHIETLLCAWENWEGGFIDFCEHVQQEQRVPFSRAHIGDILEAHGVRLRNRRGRGARDSSALRDGFEIFFPGAQWVGDGTQVAIEICGQRFECNLELAVDASTGAFVGASLRPTEDSAAVIEVFADGVTTTEKPPLAFLLDNKPSNHTAQVHAALGETLPLRSRPFKPTDKPHVEGGFGLFAQDVPPLIITATSLEELAAQVLQLVVTTWGRAKNHRPRADRGGKSRVELYREHSPTDQEVALAKAALEQRLRRQEQALKTRAARLDPVVRGTLDEAFTRLELDDPDGYLKTAIASFPLDAIVAGVATFEGMQQVGSLPKDVDARYLRGIVRRIAQETEGWAIAEALLRARLAARDRVLAGLQCRRDDFLLAPLQAVELLKTLLDQALCAQRRIDHLFWLLAATDVIRDQPADQHRELLRLAARRIHSTQSVPHRDRLAATRYLFAKVVAIA